MSKPTSRDLQIHEKSAQHLGASPWTAGQRIKMLCWEYSWNLFCRWTPKPANPWRLFVLKVFGATIEGRPFVHQRARIQIPWHLEIHDRASIGDRTNLYTLDRIVIGERSIVAQEAYLCTGSHSLSRESKPLKTAPINIGKDVFIGARAFILPGATLNKGSVIGACEVYPPRKEQE